MDDHPFTFMARTPPRADAQNILCANGIFADTGLPLLEIDEKTAAEIVKSQTMPREEELASKSKHENATQPTYGTVGDVDPNKLEEAGWGIVFHKDASDEIKQALRPLMEHRKKQVGNEKLFRVFENADGYRPGESCTDWLARHGVAMNPVDPAYGVPFYLLLVGSPGEIPFEFQYLLDINWGVGRVHFDDPADYRRYAESVVSYEEMKELPYSRTAAVFATRHELDKATEMFMDLVAIPLVKGDDKRGPLGERQKFHVQPFLGDLATKANLSELLRAKSEAGRPVLLFTGSHGMGFKPDDPRLPDTQGALLCQDWEGFGKKITKDEWFAGADLDQIDDAQVHGLIHFFFACYGAGCPELDDFVKKPDAGPDRIAPRPLVSKLPQRMLAHRNGGALACLGHVDRAWSHSFYSGKAGPQLQGFRDVLGHLLKGSRLGFATDQFDVRSAALSAELLEILNEIRFGKKVSDADLIRLWTARNDARNYIVLGDPAVKLRVEDIK
jgi:hypothetical protein